MTIGFYSLIHHGPLGGGLIERYFAMHPVEYAIAGMFFVGLASIGLIYLGIMRQYAGLANGSILPPPTGRKEDVSDCRRHLETVESYERKFGKSYYTNRLRRVFAGTVQSDSTANIENEIRYLAEEDNEKAESGYGFVRMILWAVPMLGFLGTVIGIALALGELSPEAMEESLPMVMANLTVAFDTTAIAITLDIILFFLQFWTSREETKLLWEVEQVVDAEVRGRFEIEGAVGPDEQGQIHLVRKMLEAMLTSIQELTKVQSNIWEQAVSSADSRYAKMASETAVQFKNGLAAAIRENLEAHADGMLRAEQVLIEQNSHNARQFTEAMRANLESLNSMQGRILQQGEMMRGILDATGEIASLEERLNQNLAALSGSANFEETINRLAATIHLLNAKHLGGGNPNEENMIRLPRGDKGKGYAA